MFMVLFADVHGTDCPEDSGKEYEVDAVRAKCSVNVKELHKILLLKLIKFGGKEKSFA